MRTNKRIWLDLLKEAMRDNGENISDVKESSPPLNSETFFKKFKHEDYQDGSVDAVKQEVNPFILWTDDYVYFSMCDRITYYVGYAPIDPNKNYSNDMGFNAWRK